MNELKHILPGEPIPRGSIFHERRYRVALQHVKGLEDGGRLLDIGCGNASQTEYFAKRMEFAAGIDLQANRLPGFRRDLVSRKISNILLMGGNSETLPFKDDTFDFVTCFEMLEHVFSQDQTLQEIRRVLKPGGNLIMSVPHRWWIFETHGADLPLLPWNRVPFFSWLPKPIHDRWARARIYTRAKIEGIVQSAGFTDVTTELLTAPMDVVKNERLKGLLRKQIFRGDTTKVPVFSSTIFVKAKKT